MNAELIDALRNCACIKSDASCANCGYARSTECKWRMIEDAAAALEAAEKRIAELSLDCEMYQQKCMELDAKMQTVTECHALEESER